MRALLLAILLVTAAPWAAPAQSIPINYFADLESSLPRWSADSSLVNAVTMVVEQMPYLDSLRAHVLDVSSRHQYRVDIICQHHNSKRIKVGVERDGVIDCQRQVYDLLDSLDGPVVVGEGWPSDRIKHLDILDMVTRNVQRDSLHKDTATLECALLDYLDVQGVDNFVWTHPDARVYGFESPRLMHLNVLLLHQRDDCRKVGCQRYGELTDFYMQLIRARSELALIRVINRLDMKHEERGVIVIGSGHCRDFEKLAEQYHVTLSFFSADRPRAAAK